MVMSLLVFSSVGCQLQPHNSYFGPDAWACTEISKAGWHINFQLLPEAVSHSNDTEAVVQR